mmetsp:Transcript_24345/g.60378  ORF Transcript_24345/g.60378 Transcript_24345/m.60378 type:complete len:88 (-) Transcript_24345:369-632(-)
MRSTTVVFTHFREKSSAPASADSLEPLEVMQHKPVSNTTPFCQEQEVLPVRRCRLLPYSTTQSMSRHWDGSAHSLCYIQRGKKFRPI